MKPLFIFETPKKKKSIDAAIERVSEYVKKISKSLNYNIELIQIEEIGLRVLLKVSLKNKMKSILIVPWLRPYTFGRTTVKIVADYPRLNISKKFKGKANEDKLIGMQEIVKKFDLCFLVILQKSNGNDLYWLDWYSDIPKEYWELTYRKKETGLDRIHFPNYTRYDFQTVEGLKAKLNKIFKNED
jgi:hypothetical protein